MCLTCRIVARETHQHDGDSDDGDDGVIDDNDDYVKEHVDLRCV